MRAGPTAAVAMLLAGCSSVSEPEPAPICMLDPRVPVQLACSVEPRRVADDPGFIAIAAGSDHTCALDAEGRAYCWGRALSGPVDLRTGEGISPRPVALAGGHAFVSIAAGDDFTCALTAQAEAWCWGWNHSGQLGAGAREGDALLSSAEPVRVAGGVTFSALGLGRQHACALSMDGAAWCWGMDWFGEVGRGYWETEAQPTPFPVAGGRTFAMIDGGQRFTCALGGAGDAWCWGHGHIGELGTSQTSLCVDLFTVRCSPWPVPVATPQRFVWLSSGISHACGLTAGGRTFCWGDSGQGQRGPTPGDGFTPGEVPGPAFVGIRSGGSTNCGLTATGEAYCWGGNWHGQLGTGTRAYSDPRPSRIAGGHRFRDLSIGLAHACGITDGGATYCWGSNESGQLGAGVW